MFSRVGHNVMRDVPEELAAVLLDFIEHGVINSQTLANRFEAHSGLQVRQRGGSGFAQRVGPPRTGAVLISDRGAVSLGLWWAIGRSRWR